VGIRRSRGPSDPKKSKKLWTQQNLGYSLPALQKTKFQTYQTAQALLLAQDRCPATMMFHANHTIDLLHHLDPLAPQLCVAFQLFSKMMLHEGISCDEAEDDGEGDPVSVADTCRGCAVQVRALRFEDAPFIAFSVSTENRITGIEITVRFRCVQKERCRVNDGRKTSDEGDPALMADTPSSAARCTGAGHVLLSTNE
jgi:hypothetical protein